MRNNQNIFLIGPMAAGKTTIGQQLADSLNREFYDTDHEIEVRTGVDIPWIFDVEGEEGFYNREAEVLLGLSEMQGIVLATGGGIVVSPENSSILGARGFVVYLKVSLEKQIARTEKGNRRPLLQVEDPKAKLVVLQAEREPLYEILADFTIATDMESPQLVVKKIIERFQKYEHDLV